MIRIDQRVGSGELEKYFRPYGVKTEKTKLDYGDFDFEGQGPKGLCGVVFERKRIEDLVDSMQSNRLTGHQLPGIARNYDYGYLIIEGAWRSSTEGLLEIPGRWGVDVRRIPARAVRNFVMGLTLRGGLIPWRTWNQEETVEFIVDQYRMWEKPWAEHTSHEAIYAPAEATGSMTVIRSRPMSRAEKIAMQLPGLDGKARYAAQKFKTPLSLITAKEGDWARMPWKTKKGQDRLLGAVTAKKICEAIRSAD